MAPEALAPEESRVSSLRAPRWTLAVPLVLHGLLAGIYLFLLPLWGSVPDEPLHYSHMRYVAHHWRLPLISAPFRDLQEYYFIDDPAGTAAHGPVYYWPGAVLYTLTQGMSLHDQQYVIRAYSFVLGLLMVYTAWRAFALLFAGDPWVVFAATVLTTVMPHRLMISSVIYLDSMAALTSTVSLWALVAAVYSAPQRGWRPWLWAGAALGLAVLTKQTGLVLVPGALVAWGCCWRETRVALRTAATWLGAATLGALTVCGWWYVRNGVVYGQIMPMEPRNEQQTWLDVLLTGQSAWYLWFVTRGFWLSLWSQVGWLPPAAVKPMYGTLLGVTAVLLVGIVAGSRQGYRGLPPQALCLLSSFGVTVATTWVAALQWVVMFPHNNEETGKHAQAILVALVALAAAGWRYLLGPRRVAPLLLAGAGLMLVFNGLSIYHLATDLIPRYARPDPPLASWKVKDLPTRGVPGVQYGPDIPGGSDIHGQKGHNPDTGQQVAWDGAEEIEDAHPKEGDGGQRYEHVPSAGVELDVHGPEGPLLASEDESRVQAR
jgi:4-amino-4-deoxy-L-arabinose transferase-like glycosyltransferase